MKLLEIQSSVRHEGSISRTLSDEFIQAWQTTHPNIQHKQRDVGIDPPAHPTALWTQANYLPPEERSPKMVAALSISEALIEELLWADYLLLGVPMYNFSVPSTLRLTSIILFASIARFLSLPKPIRLKDWQKGKRHSHQNFQAEMAWTNTPSQLQLVLLLPLSLLFVFLLL